MISTSQREHLTYSLILQIAILAGLAIVGMVYILPGIQQINANEESTINTVEQYKKIKENGLTFDELGRELSELKGKEELLKIIKASPTEAQAVMRKTEPGDYTDWLYKTIGDSGKDRNDLKAVKMLINSILPTMSPTSGTIDEEYMTLKSYIKFIEQKFLEEYNITSNIVLGVQGISYSTDPLIKNIGSFELRLDFRATNEDIQKLITYVNESGNPDLLSGTGITIVPEDTDKTIRSKITKYLQKGTSDDSVLLANPLMTIEALSLENVLDNKKPGSVNNGRITIRFYVRGSSEEDITFLQNTLTAKQESLKKEITNAINECKAQDLLCTDLSKLQTFEKKYNEFTRSLNGTRGIKDTDMAILSQIASSFRVLDEEFKNITKNTNRK